MTRWKAAVLVCALAGGLLGAEDTAFAQPPRRSSLVRVDIPLKPDAPDRCILSAGDMIQFDAGPSGTATSETIKEVRIKGDKATKLVAITADARIKPGGELQQLSGGEINAFVVAQKSGKDTIEIVLESGKTVKFTVEVE